MQWHTSVIEFPRLGCLMKWPWIHLGSFRSGTLASWTKVYSYHDQLITAYAFIWYSYQLSWSRIQGCTIGASASMVRRQRCQPKLHHTHTPLAPSNSHGIFFGASHSEYFPLGSKTSDTTILTVARANFVSMTMNRFVDSRIKGNKICRLWDKFKP